MRDFSEFLCNSCRLCSIQIRYNPFNPRHPRSINQK